MSKVGVSRELLIRKFTYDPETGLLIRRENSGTAKAGDVAGSHHSLGYIEVRVTGKLIKAHRIIWMMVHGEWPKSQIDHINGVRNDNRIENLREADNALNMKNKRNYSNNRSGLPGVQFCRGKWHTNIKSSPGRQAHIGCFDSLFEAACARKSAENKFGYHKNHGRSV